MLSEIFYACSIEAHSLVISTKNDESVDQVSASHNLSLYRDGLLRNRDLLPRQFKCLVNDIPHTATAGYFHMDDCDGFYRMAGEDLCHLRDIPLNIRIQFRAEDDHDSILQELRMKPCVSEGYTVSSDQQIGIIEIRSS